MGKPNIAIPVNYERLPIYYYYCGVTVHEAKDYEKKFIDQKKGKEVKELQKLNKFEYHLKGTSTNRAYHLKWRIIPSPLSFSDRMPSFGRTFGTHNLFDILIKRNLLDEFESDWEVRFGSKDSTRSSIRKMNSKVETQ